MRIPTKNLLSHCFPTNVNNSKIVPKHLSGNLVSESNIRKMAAGDYNGITKECDEGFYDMYDNKKGSLSANLCALRLGLEPRTL